MVLDCLRWSGRSCPGTKQMGILNSYWPVHRYRERKRESGKKRPLGANLSVTSGVESRRAGKREEEWAGAGVDGWPACRRFQLDNWNREESWARDALVLAVLCGLPTFYKSHTRGQSKEQGRPRTFAHFGMRLKFAFFFFFPRDFFSTSISNRMCGWTWKTLMCDKKL